MNCSCHAAQASKGNFQKTCYKTFYATCRPRLYLGEHEDAAGEPVNPVNVSHVAVAELLHERESHAVQPRVRHGADDVGGRFVHDHEVLVFVDYLDRLVEDGRLVHVQDPGKVVPVPQHHLSRIPDIRCEEYWTRDTNEIKVWMVR